MFKIIAIYFSKYSILKFVSISKICKTKYEFNNNTYNNKYNNIYKYKCL